MPSRTEPNGNSKLEDAIATLIQNQAVFISATTEYRRDITRIETELAKIRILLLRHERAMSDLAEAVRERIGFKPS
jgi:hypothetical protein